ncbi:MAG: GNAT family N-acetyltransferase [Actinomycetota bacterium]|nr:GNAT family N-acetyltransferase [Actinomycetota bacterium]
MIRAAGPADAPASAWLRRRWRLERHGTALDADDGFDVRFAQWYAQQLDCGARAWLALDGGNPVGMLVMFVHERMPEPDRDAGRWGYVGNVFVLPHHREAGVGRRLLDAALDHGFARVVLNPTPRSVPFYERAGFGGDHPLLVWE